ncbi:myb-like protein AA isoform X2 [Temnothorax curvispinosus]|uniref:Myb-like protein AA isoform X2 n=1 Tax=Temnothorax curvispinosus TaxID=300111 RepID=A0A6J1RJN8_9HYME|nr:myb-like protein AA isoform X2 [Temnothorax curvispinosus]
MEQEQHQQEQEQEQQQQEQEQEQEQDQQRENSISNRKSPSSIRSEEICPWCGIELSEYSDSDSTRMIGAKRCSSCHDQEMQAEMLSISSASTLTYYDEDFLSSDSRTKDNDDDAPDKDADAERPIRSISVSSQPETVIDMSSSLPLPSNELSGPCFPAKRRCRRRTE